MKKWLSLLLFTSLLTPSLQAQAAEPLCANHWELFSGVSGNREHQSITLGLDLTPENIKLYCGFGIEGQS